MSTPRKDNWSIPEVIESTLKGIASIFPVTSGLASVYSDWKNKIQIKNIKDILTMHAQSLQKLESVIDSKFINSENYAMLMHRTVNKGKDELRQKKKQLFADFLTKSCLPDRVESEDKDVFLDILDRIDLEHFRVLKSIFNTIDYKEGKTEEQIALNLDLSQEESLSKVNYLMSLGLAKIFNHFRIDDNGNLLQTEKYIITPLGIRLVSYMT